MLTGGLSGKERVAALSDYVMTSLLERCTPVWWLSMFSLHISRDGEFDSFL